MLLRAAALLMFVLLGAMANAENVAAPHTFGHLSNYGSQLSPDGAWLLHLQRNLGRSSLILSRADGSASLDLVKPEENLTIYFAVWAHKARRVIVSAGLRGSNLEMLFAFDIDDHDRVMQRVDLLASLQAPEPYFVSAGARGNLGFPIAIFRDSERAEQHSLFQLDMSTGVLLPIEREGKIVPFSFAACPTQTFGVSVDTAAEGSRRAAVYFVKQQGAWHELRRIGEESRAAGTALASCSEVGREIYFLDADARDYLSLATYDLDSLRIKQVSADKGDIVNILFNRRSGKVASYTTEYDSPQLHMAARDASTAASTAATDDVPDLERAVRDRFHDEAEILSCSDDNRRCLVAGASRGQVDTIYLWTASRPDDLAPLYPARGDLAAWQLQAQRAQIIRARDGVELIAYVTMPSRTCPAEGCKTVLLVHGGPGERDGVHAEPITQWLAAQGYLVMSVNYRGSHGVGRQLEALGKQEWGLKMQDDLDDLARWSVDNGLSQAGRIAVMGSGYGGFAALNAVMRKGNSYACAVNMSGMTDLGAFVAQRVRAMPEIEEELVARIGDPSRAEVRERMLAHSPIGMVAGLNVPILVTAVERDPYAPLENFLDFESRINAAGKGNLLSFFAFKGTGHVFNSESNEQVAWHLVDRFLSRCMGAGPDSEAVGLGAATFARSNDGLHLLP
jgi:dipeptidyl aminopeptidase/acylaminoacyl peptidase